MGGLSQVQSRDACDVRRSMPLLYNGRRGAMEETAKLAAWRAAITLTRETRMFTQHPTWEDLAILASAHSALSTRSERLLMQEEHIAATQAEPLPLQLAYGVTPDSVVEKRFSIMATVPRGLKSSKEQATILERKRIRRHHLMSSFRTCCVRLSWTAQRGRRRCGETGGSADAPYAETPTPEREAL